MQSVSGISLVLWHFTDWDAQSGGEEKSNVKATAGLTFSSVSCTESHGCVKGFVRLVLALNVRGLRISFFYTLFSARGKSNCSASQNVK